MARRRGYGGARDPQSALSNSKFYALTRVIREMRNKQIAMAKQPFEMHELMDLFVLPEHHVHLRYVYDLVEPSGHTSTLNVKADVPPHQEQHASPHLGRGCFMQFSWYGKKDGGFYVPEEFGSEDTKPAHVLHQHAKPENVEKYVQVEQDLLDIQCRFALTEKVLVHLNKTDNCKTLPQIRYVWPAVVILLKKGGYGEEAAMLAEPSARAGDKVVLDEWTSRHVKETNDTIVRAMMLDDMPTPSETDLPVSYQLSDNFATQ